MLTYYFKIVHYYNITYIRRLIMHGNKWADYIITAVRKDTLGRVTNVQIGPDPVSGNTVHVTSKTKDEVILIIKSGKTVITSFGGTKGEIVEHVNGYLRTNPNCQFYDNLDNLPKF